MAFLQSGPLITSQNLGGSTECWAEHWEWNLRQAMNMLCAPRHSTEPTPVLDSPRKMGITIPPRVSVGIKWGITRTTWQCWWLVPSQGTNCRCYHQHHYVAGSEGWAEESSNDPGHSDYKGVYGERAAVISEYSVSGRGRSAHKTYILPMVESEL